MDKKALDQLGKMFTNNSALIKQEMQEMKSELKQEMQEMKSELKQEMQEMKSELKQEMQEMKSELKQEIKSSQEETIEAVTDLFNEGFNNHEERIAVIENHLEISPKH